MIKLFVFILISGFLVASVYSQTGYRDPFEPVIKEEAAESSATGTTTTEETKELPASMVVEGILWGTDDPRAIISSEVYKVGDVVKGVGAKIIKIEGNSVYIGYGETVYRMSVKEN